MRDSIKKIVLSLFPELNGGLHLPKRGRVVAVNDPPESSISNSFRPYLAVDIQPIDSKKELPIVTGVPVPLMGAGEKAGVFAIPQVGSLVVYGFIDGQPDKPFIIQSLPDGLMLPECDESEIVFQNSDKNYFKLDQSGNQIQRSPGKIYKEAHQIHEVSKQHSSSTVNHEIEVAGRSSWLVKGILKICAFTGIKLISAKKLEVAAGDRLDVISGNKANFNVGGDHSVVSAKDFQHKIEQNAQTIAKIRNDLMVNNGGKMWVGDETDNIFKVLSDTLNIVASMAQTLATHTHPKGSPPNQASSFTASKSAFESQKQKVDKLI